MNISTVKKKKGFTLIELLVVIGILVVLATVVVLVLNPAEIFRQARDSKRISDLSSLKSAITFYVSTVASPTLFDGDACEDDGSFWDSTGGETGIAGNGWIQGLDFTVDANDVAVPGGSPISIMPIDPRWSAAEGEPASPADGNTLQYQFRCSDSSGHFMLTANMESNRYSTGGTDDVESNTRDGGTDDDVYEIGTCVGGNYDGSSICD